MKLIPKDSAASPRRAIYVGEPQQFRLSGILLAVLYFGFTGDFYADTMINFKPDGRDTGWQVNESDLFFTEL